MAKISTAKIVVTNVIIFILFMAMFTWIEWLVYYPERFWGDFLYVVFTEYLWAFLFTLSAINLWFKHRLQE